MKPVREVVSRDVIEDLWGAGYTILPRRRHSDPFFVPPEMVPATRSYQWMHLVEDKVMINGRGWVAVPASRHDGYFMPAGHIGDIEVSGLGLFEKPKFEVDAERQAGHDKAHKNVSDWVEKTSGQFSGHVVAGGVSSDVGDGGLGRLLFPETKTIETTVAIPPDMFPHMSLVFAERDKLYADLMERWNDANPLTEMQDKVCIEYQSKLQANPDLLKGPTFLALLLPYAIENVRERLKEGEK